MAEQQSLYTIFRLEKGHENRYALYKITNVKLSHDEPNQAPRATAILQFPCRRFPSGMGFIALGSKLYCIGGQKHRDSISKKVYVVDLNTLETCYKENRSPFVRVSDMHEGKHFPYVFTWNGKIYVMDGCGEEDAKISNHKGRSNFEVFDPEIGEWSVLPRHNFNSKYSQCYISGHALVGDRVFLSDHGSCFMKVFSFDLENKNWVREDDREDDREEEVVIRDYMSAWSKTLNTRHGIPSYCAAVTVNNTCLYALTWEGFIATYHISNNEDDRYIPIDKVKGIELEYLYIDHAELIHLGDEKFCLAMTRCQRDYDHRGDKEFSLLTFQVVKQKGSKPDQLLCWADIYDFHVVDALLSRGKFLYACAV